MAEVNIATKQTDFDLDQLVENANRLPVPLMNGQPGELW